MPEISDNAAIFIATSFQAYKRAEIGDSATIICNCTVSLVFAGFYLEENLDMIIRCLKKDDEIRKYFGYKESKPVGMLYKLAWFYNSYVSKPSIPKDALLRKSETGKYLILSKLNEKFPGFERLYQFRNDIAHGKINRFANFKDTHVLRQQAKDIVSELIKIANQHVDKPIFRMTTYFDAISDFCRIYPDTTDN